MILFTSFTYTSILYTVSEYVNIYCIRICMAQKYESVVSKYPKAI